jgi:AraC family transcriptional regulator
LCKSRLIRAARLIAAGTLPLAAIALESGYYDQSHFTRAFARFMSASPSQYRRARL